MRVANLAVFLLLVLAPLIRGGNRPIALLILELLGLALIAWMTLSKQMTWGLTKRHWAFITVLIAYPLLQLLPLPFELWQGLPGHAFYAEIIAQTSPQHSLDTWLAGSLTPEMTTYSLLALIPSVATFLLIASSSEDKSASFASLLIGLAVFQALLGLVQYANGPESILRLGWTHGGNSAIGTYANRDHLAGLLEMVLPLTLAVLVANVRHHFKSANSPTSWKFKLLHAPGWHMKRFTLYAGASLIILLGLIFTQSRSGVSLGMLTIFLSAIVFSVKLKNNRQAGLIFSIAAIVLMLAIEIGLVPILNRFAFEDPLKDSRWLIYSDTARAIGEFLPLGSGFGSFSQVYARFQSQELLGVFINHAHNDYLEWLMEGGIVVAGLLIGFLTLFAIQLSKLWGYQRWSKIHYIQVGAAIGIIAIGLHSLFDFNLHIPANQIYFASLCGLFFRPTQQYGVTIAKSTI